MTYVEARKDWGYQTYAKLILNRVYGIEPEVNYCAENVDLVVKKHFNGRKKDFMKEFNWYLGNGCGMAG
jgi:hypothetical protein